MNNTPHDSIHQAVRERYGPIAARNGSCCAPSCCSSKNISEDSFDGNKAALGLGYESAALTSVPEGSNLGLGCGNPQAIASLKPGETVLDLGSGAGFDVFLAAHAVGPTGKVWGVDMTPEMIAKARDNARKGGFSNVEFIEGHIESVPLPDSSVDVILSNCVINLSPDKGRVFTEAYRVLKPGGRLAISDIVALSALPDHMKKDWEFMTGCVAGALPIETNRILLETAGFVDVRITRKSTARDIVESWFPGQNVADYVSPATIEAIKPSHPS